ncbi:hypothetical protein KAW38_01565 [Candidatus Micrarchaeota archaeon]|nr:hypothetical protein [Candidatus Micrarchaeota archaeon]
MQKIVKKRILTKRNLLIAGFATAAALLTYNLIKKPIQIPEKPKIIEVKKKEDFEELMLEPHLLLNAEFSKVQEKKTDNTKTFSLYAGRKIILPNGVSLSFREITDDWDICLNVYEGLKLKRKTFPENTWIDITNEAGISSKIYIEIDDESIIKVTTEKNARIGEDNNCEPKDNYEVSGKTNLFFGPLKIEENFTTLHDCNSNVIYFEVYFPDGFPVVQGAPRIYIGNYKQLVFDSVNSKLYFFEDAQLEYFGSYKTKSFIVDGTNYRVSVEHLGEIVRVEVGNEFGFYELAYLKENEVWQPFSSLSMQFFNPHEDQRSLMLTIGHAVPLRKGEIIDVYGNMFVIENVAYEMRTDGRNIHPYVTFISARQFFNPHNIPEESYE